MENQDRHSAPGVLIAVVLHVVAFTLWRLSVFSLGLYVELTYPVIMHKADEGEVEDAGGLVVLLVLLIVVMRLLVLLRAALVLEIEDEDDDL